MLVTIGLILGAVVTTGVTIFVSMMDDSCESMGARLGGWSRALGVVAPLVFSACTYALFGPIGMLTGYLATAVRAGVFFLWKFHLTILVKMITMSETIGKSSTMILAILVNLPRLLLLTNVWAKAFALSGVLFAIVSQVKNMIFFRRGDRIYTARMMRFAEGEDTSLVQGFIDGAREGVREINSTL